jgi:hypothetical protein
MNNGLFQQSQPSCFGKEGSTAEKVPDQAMQTPGSVYSGKQ